MAYRDYPDYDRERLYDDRDAYSATIGYERGTKRPRSTSPSELYRVAGTGYQQDDAYRGGWEVDRLRGRDDYDRAAYSLAGGAAATIAPGGSASAYSPPDTYAQGPRRTWAELSAEEKEREWARYDRELEWERYHAAERETDGYRADYDDRYMRHEYDRSREPEHWSAHARGPRLGDPMDSPTILPFRRYAQLLRELGKEPCALASGPEATQQLYDKYQEYRTAFNRRAMLQFWEAHKEAKWFKEKYGLTEEQVEARKQRRKQGRQGRKQTWLDELQSGKLDKLTWDAVPASLGEPLENGTSAPGGGLSVTSRYGELESIDSQEVTEVPLEPNQILIRHIPTEVGREDLEAVLRNEEGFRYLALGEPHPAKRLTRMGWAMFVEKDSSALQAIADRLSQVVVQGQKLATEITSRPAQAKLKVAPAYASTLQRLAQDFTQAQELVAFLEGEDRDTLWKGEEASEALDVDASTSIADRCKAIGYDLDDASESSWLGSLVKGDNEAISATLSGMDEALVQKRCSALKKALDLHIDMLRQVYHCDYYSSTLCDFPEELRRRSPRVVRRTARELTREANNAEKLWATNVDTKHKLLMRPNDNDIEALGGKALDKHLLDLAAPYSQQDEAEKHRCIVKVNGEECGKPFKAQNFVQKHVLNKHRSWFDELTKDEQYATRYFNNYVRDPQRVMPPLTTDRNGRDANGSAGGGPGSSLSARLGGFEHAGNGAGAYGTYGAGSLMRLGSHSYGASRGSGNGAGAPGKYDRYDEPAATRAAYSTGRDRQASIGGASEAAAARRRDPLPSAPKPLDPRANNGPRSYQDLDAGAPAETADIELEY